MANTDTTQTTHNPERLSLAALIIVLAITSTWFLTQTLTYLS